MLLMPRVIKPIMDGLTLLRSRRVAVCRRSSVVRSSYWPGSGITAGAYGGGIGKPDFIPLTILIAVCVPGNQVLPLAILQLSASLWRWQLPCIVETVPHLNLGCHHYEHHPVDRDQTIGLHTQLAANAGALKAGGWWLQWIRAVLPLPGY